MWRDALMKQILLASNDFFFSKDQLLFGLIENKWINYWNRYLYAT